MKYAGLDISKNTIDIAIKSNNTYQMMSISNNLNGYQQLHQWLSKEQVKHICMEATGNYHLPVAHYLDNDFFVSVENPLKIKRYTEITLTRTKNDKQDARKIADYCATMQPEKWKKPSINQQLLEELLACQNQLINQRTAMKNRLQVANNCTVQNSYSIIIESLNIEIQRIKSEIKKQIQNDETLLKDYQRLQSIDGIGKDSATGILHYLNKKHFNNVKQYIAYLGLCPSERTSGSSVKGKSHLTRYGHRKAKSYYFMPALVAYHRNMYPDFITRLKAKGKPKMVIIIALMRKLATIAYYIYTGKQTFERNRYRPEVA